VRTRLAVVVLVGLVVVAALSTVVFGWYGFRVLTELRPGSWRTPTEIVDHNGKTFLSVYGSEWRVTQPVVLSELPDHVPNAFLAAEDVRFRRHLGVDPLGIGRAALRNVAARGVAQGGSTITQQLAKNQFLTTERTFTRKAIEAVLAVLIEVRLSKDEILEAYLNDVYLGHRDGRSILGLDEAARAYFNKAPKNLNAAEAALLAGMIRAPNRDNPNERAKVAKDRRDAVLGVMLDRGWISKEEHDTAVGRRVRFRPGTLQRAPHPYLIAALRAEIAEELGARRLRGGPMKINTSIDADMQKAAETAVRGGTSRLRGRYSWLRRKDPLQAAILSVDPATGGIRALVGGSDFRKSQFDRTRRMRRQPGSAFKPFTYAAAIAAKDITPATVVEDKPVEIQLARNDIWRPQNYDQRFRGRVTVREAFEKSLNAPAVRIADEVGVKRVANILDDAGVEGELSDTPALALGVDDVSMRELVGAYTIFPNLGIRTEPHLIDSIESASGRRVYRFKQRKREIIDPEVAFVVHSLMRGVVQRGTASDLSHLGLGHIAGKTGTTNDYRDAWFVGYAPDLLTAAWVGFDDGTPLRISSAEAALPIWAAFMSRAAHQRSELLPPDGVSVVAIEPASGLRWRSGCGDRFEEAFITGTEPEAECRGRVQRPPITLAFQEPPVITPEQSQEWSAEIPGMGEVQIIIDPAAGLPPEQDENPDELNQQERDAIDRQLEEAREAVEQALPEPPANMPPAATPPTFDPRQAQNPGREAQNPGRAEKEERKEKREQEKEERKEEREEERPPNG
jgi:penicillin-binding protein 1B